MAAPKNAVREAIKAVLQDEPAGLYRREIVARAGMVVSSTHVAIKEMCWSGDLERVGGPPALYRLADKAKVKAQAEELKALPRSIDLWKLPPYVPPRWNVREGAGRVRA